ncbi:type I restriction endonuclease [Candidatus Lokiarchaeum ossiferum]|uniref:type I restriction endonuclease n=1 Tax=Candidatus Lokiarchaeum ossiferum TaxID=2951803 RepID=UPI00352D580A
MINKRVIWQESAGDTNRDYVNICLKYDVILNGPGRFGSWPECKTGLIKYGIEIGVNKSKKAEDLRRFAKDMQEGDIVILRTGTNFVHAIGIISGVYFWCNLFSDVDGWDLQHVRRVKWIWIRENNKPKDFPVNTLKQGDTTQQLGTKEKRKPLLDWLKSLDLNYDEVDLQVSKLPKLSPVVSLDQIGEYLFSKGVSSNSIENLKDVIDDLQMIARWYDNDYLLDPSEFETEAYLVIPLLRALGWTPQKMALEFKSEDKGGKKIDIALFSNLPRSDETIVSLIEAKRKGESVFNAFQQAKDYAEGKTTINRLVVSDGIRYGIFTKNKDDWQLLAYMNLTSFHEEYKIYDAKGILEALWVMSPEWN